MSKRNRLFAILLALAMIVTYMPGLAFAETAPDNDQITTIDGQSDDLGDGENEDLEEGSDDSDVVDGAEDPDGAMDEEDGADDGDIEGDENDGLEEGSENDDVDGDTEGSEDEDDNESEALWEVWAEEDSFYISKNQPTAELEVVVDTENCDTEPELSYCWYREYDGEETEIPEADGAIYSAEGLGVYHCVVTDENGCSKQVDFTVLYQTDWSVYPDGIDHIINEDEPTTELQVYADTVCCEPEPKLSYSWYIYDNEECEYVPIPGANEHFYTADSVGEYHCVVSDQDGHSNSVTFFVTDKAQWDAGAKGCYYISKKEPTAKLKVMVDTENCESEPELSYSWYIYDNEEYEYMPISGANEATYIADSVGEYCCEVSDEEGRSKKVYISVCYETDWIAEAEKREYYISKKEPTTELKVEVNTESCESEPELSYSWYIYDNEEYEYMPISGANGATYTADSVGEYYCEVSDEEGNSNNVNFNVEYKTDWIAEAEKDEYYISKKEPTAELKVNVNTDNCDSDPELSYSWFTEDDSEIPGADGPICTVNNDGNYYCKVTDNEGHSSTVHIYVDFKTDWTVDVEHNEYFISKKEPTAELKVNVNTDNCDSDPELSYRWYKEYSGEDDCITEDQEADGPICTVNSEGYYCCIITDNDGHWSCKDFWVYYETDWTVDPEKDEYYISKKEPTAELKVTVDTENCDTDPELSYRWYSYDDEETEIPGAEGATFTVDHEGTYYCVVTDEKGYSNRVSFWVPFQTDWTIDSEKEVYYISKKEPTAELKVTVDTENCDTYPELSYRWYKDYIDDETEISGAEGATYTVDREGSYYCVVTDEEGYSDRINFRVDYQIDWAIEVEEDWLLISESNPTAELKVIVNTENCDPVPTLSYCWYKDNSYDEIEITGADGPTYTADSLGHYYCEITDEEGHSAGKWFRVSSWKAYADEEDVYLKDGSATLKAIVEPDDFECTYQWYKYVEEAEVDEDIEDSLEPIEGATSATYTTSNKEEYLCRVTSKDDVDEYENVWFAVLSEPDDPGHEHTWNDGEITTAPTCNKEGIMTYTCTECGETKTEVISATDNHIAGEALQENKVDPTCTEAGSYDEVVNCTVCGKELSRERKTTPELGHDMVVVSGTAKEPTCGEAGKEADKKCSRCGKAEAGAEIPATGKHTAGEALQENKVDPTCTEAGSYDEVVKCTVCGKELSRKPITVPALGHDMVEVSGTAKEPTCSEAGKEADKKCSRCGKVEAGAEIPATDNHTAGEAVRENEHDPTCAEEGSYDEVVKCTVCGKELSRKPITVPALGHDMVEVSGTAKEPTCSEAGKEADKKCSRCGKVEAGAEIPATGNHTWNSTYTVDKKATYAAVGSKSIHCSVCGAKKPGSAVSIPKLKVKTVALTSVKAAKKGFTAKWGRGVSVNGYELQYALNAKFTSGKKLVRITKPATVSKKVTKLKAKKKYYVRVRSYKTVSGKKYYSSWSKYKAVKTK